MMRAMRTSRRRDTAYALRLIGSTRGVRSRVYTGASCNTRCLCRARHCMRSIRHLRRLRSVGRMRTGCDTMSSGTRGRRRMTRYA